MREKSEDLWIKSVFQDILLHDCPFKEQVYLDEHDIHESSSNLDITYDEEGSYKVISKFALPGEYNDRDNPIVNTQDESTMWIHEKGKWKPPPSTVEAESSQQQSICILDNIHHIQTYYPIGDNKPHTLETDQNKIMEVRSMSQQNKDSTMMLLQQSDTGANACATNNLHALTDIVYINPISINSAHKSAPMSMKAVGRMKLLSLNGETIAPLCYYSPDIDGTIISPTAIVQEYRSKFKGFQKICDCEKNKGYLQFDAKNDSNNSLVLPLIGKNNLWYHETMTTQQEPARQDSHIHQMSINKLSNAASYEIWHQRLCHPGKNVMQSIHKHSIGIPPLKGNSFWKCNSCMSSKSQKTYHTKDHKSKLVSKWKKTTLKDLLLEDEMNNTDDFYMPNALPGQHFHCDFGFMRSKSYQHKDEEGKIQTSIDGKNAYLLVIDRSTRYMWVYISNSKRPPVQFCKTILSKFKSSTKHRSIRCDQGELATSHEFQQMVKDEGFTLEVTGSNNSKQNGMAERPHRTLAQMVRCCLHSSGLGPEYWSYALQHCVCKE